jgi:hypothetical protein
MGLSMPRRATPSFQSTNQWHLLALSRFSAVAPLASVFGNRRSSWNKIEFFKSALMRHLGAGLTDMAMKGLDDSERYGRIRMAFNGSLIPDRC